MATTEFEMDDSKGCTICVFDYGHAILLQSWDAHEMVPVYLEEPQCSQFINRIKALPSLKQGESESEI